MEAIQRFVTILIVMAVFKTGQTAAMGYPLFAVWASREFFEWTVTLAIVLTFISYAARSISILWDPYAEIRYRKE